MIQEAAPAKINLFLHIGVRGANGFHPLQSLVVFTGMGDELALAAAPDLSLTINGPFAGELNGEGDNLVLRAARALGYPALGGATLSLTKNLPVASGIGGGSSDAAAALRGLRRLWNADVTDAKLQEIAASLGSDIPVCVEACSAFMEGRGEILRPVAAMPRIAMLLVNPKVGVSTRDVFAALQNRSGIDLQLPLEGFRDTADLLRFLETTHNDMETPAREIQPVIGEVLGAMAQLPGALFTRMSGSGATCFGIFADDGCCRRAAKMLQEAHPGWWIAPTFVPPNGIGPEGPGQDIGPAPEGL
ncbi:MAG: 4-(cytidine 5'-diphospho)-2-C-methyl-D-erythritol kinase [Pseudomonadota bacterium]